MQSKYTELKTEIERCFGVVQQEVINQLDKADPVSFCIFLIIPFQSLNLKDRVKEAIYTRRNKSKDSKLGKKEKLKDPLKMLKFVTQLVSDMYKYNSDMYKKSEDF